MPNIPMPTLIEFAVRFLVRKGVPQANAHYIAEAVVHSEAFGITTHGLTQLRYLDSQIGTSIHPKAEPKVIKEAGATALIDGDGTFGQLAMRLAQRLAVEKAKTHGAAWIGVAKTAWIGAVGIYLIPLARAGFLAQLWAQNCACQDSPPIGGIDPRFSTNPIALAFPTGADPVLADFSTSAISMGKVSRLAKAGKKADAPIFMDNQGNITDDPAAVVDAQGHRQGGSILFMGGQDQGHKGYALSLWCEALTALVGGDCNNPDAPQRQCFTLTVLDPDAFAGREYYTTEMKRLIAWVKGARRQKGVDEIRLPGERGFRAIRQAEQRGLPLDDTTLSQLNALAQKNGLEPIKTS